MFINSRARTGNLYAHSECAINAKHGSANQHVSAADALGDIICRQLKNVKLLIHGALVCVRA
jgi:hypothetical protein